MGIGVGVPAISPETVVDPRRNARLAAFGDICFDNVRLAGAAGGFDFAGVTIPLLDFLCTIHISFIADDMVVKV